jgi:hypothetical protein
VATEGRYGLESASVLVSERRMGYRGTLRARERKRAGERAPNVATEGRYVSFCEASCEVAAPVVDERWFRCMDSNHDSGIQSPLSCL